jgi:indole-3-glycerol phosphate synthase
MIDTILGTKRDEVKALRKKRFGRRKKPVVPVVFDREVNIIAELKRRSPSAGFIAEIDTGRIRIYSRYAKAISVLADTTYFGGSPEFVQEVAMQTHLPILYKDFIIDPMQIDQAYASGADIVLLIVRILDRDELISLYRHAQDMGLACLVELHARDELERLSDLDAEMVGVNARELDTLRIDLDRASEMLCKVYAPMRIAESGIKSRKDVERFKAANGFLIGETLMRSKDLEATFAELLHG